MTVYVSAPTLPIVIAIEEADRIAAAERVGDWVESGAAMVFHDDTGSTMVVNFGLLSVVSVTDRRPAEHESSPTYTIDLRDLEAAEMLDVARSAGEHDHHHHDH